MGARFEVQHANFVAYLTTDGKADAPQCDEGTLAQFLFSLTEPGSLISSTTGSPSDWIRAISSAASAAASNLNITSNRILQTSEVFALLEPLRSYFTGYSLYVLILPSGSPDEDASSFRFFAEVAISSGLEGLVLMPDAPSQSVIQFLSPFPAIRALAENPLALPAVLFWTSRQNTCVLPLKDAKAFYRQTILPVLETQHPEIEELILRFASNGNAKRILHLSDFHFGRRDVASRRNWLKERVTQILPTIDRVIVTGDLFDHPKEEFRQLFDDFRSDVENLTSKEILVIPGNHDVRKKGNAWRIWGRNSEFISDLQWNPISIDDDLRIVFISFNSSATGDFAKGTVTEQQRRDRGTKLDQECRRRPEVAQYLKVALVHHHPYSYGSLPTALYEKILSGVFGGDEKFIAFEEADNFMEWCASRGVSLVLHGHKHIPHFITVRIPTGSAMQIITVVGCGSSTGVDGKPMCYDVITLDPVTKKWNVLFYHDPRGDGSGFSLQNVAIDLRCTDKQGKHGPKPISQQAPSASANINTDPDPTLLARAVTEIVMNDGSRNSLVNRFWELKGSQRREICLRLRLIDEQEVSLPEIQRDKRALLRAAERGMLEKLAEEIVKLEDGNDA